MERETHADLIARFVFMLPLYLLGMCITFMIFFLLLSQQKLIWNLAKFMLVGANIVLLWIAAKILRMFKSKNGTLRFSRHSNSIKYSIIYALLGVVIGLGTSGLIGLGYFFIGAFTGLKFMTSAMNWSDGFVIFVMPILLAVGSIILFIIAGIKGGKRLCRDSLREP